MKRKRSFDFRVVVVGERVNRVKSFREFAAPTLCRLLPPLSFTHLQWYYALTLDTLCCCWPLLSSIHSICIPYTPYLMISSLSPELFCYRPVDWLLLRAASSLSSSSFNTDCHNSWRYKNESRTWRDKKKRIEIKYI